MLAAPAPTVSFKLTMAEATELLAINFIIDEPVPLDAHINIKSLMLAYIVPNGLAPHTCIVYPSHEYCPAIFRHNVKALLIPCSLMVDDLQSYSFQYIFIEIASLILFMS